MTTEQQALCREIFKNLCSEDGHQRFNRQMNDDAGGFENYHVALFGEPGTDHPFEWVLTGRHNTLRADGHRHEGAAFSGPIFYGHALEHRDQPKCSGHERNVWRYQLEQANAIFSSLDDRQRAQALFRPGEAKTAGSQASDRPHGDHRDAFDGAGLAVVGLDVAQKRMVQQLLRDLTRPFRSIDAEGIQKCLRDQSGTDELRLTYFSAGQTSDRQTGDIWKLEAPTFTWHFHGTPHVHSWLNLTR